MGLAQGKHFSRLKHENPGEVFFGDLGDFWCLPFYYSNREFKNWTGERGPGPTHPQQAPPCLQSLILPDPPYPSSTGPNVVENSLPAFVAQKRNSILFSILVTLVSHPQPLSRDLDR